MVAMTLFRYAMLLRRLTWLYFVKAGELWPYMRLFLQEQAVHRAYIDPYISADFGLRDTHVHRSV